MAGAALTVVVVAHDSAADLRASLPPLLAQLGPDDGLVVVDNASADGSADRARALAPRARVVEAGANLGFAGGCNLGARGASTPLLLFLNPDAVVAGGALEALRAAAARQPSWGAWQPLVTTADPQIVNTAGNVVHYLGIAWAGGLGRATAEIAPRDAEAGFASGAALVVRREAWVAAGGFDERFFMYCEDLDLSLRLRLAGWRVGVVPAARVAHRYAFAKGERKWLLLQRNRWWTLLGTYPARLLALLAPALAATEVALLLAAARERRLGATLRAQATVLRELRAILRRRRRIQATVAISPRAFAGALAWRLDSPQLPSSRLLDLVLRTHWTLVRALLRDRPPRAHVQV